MNRRIGRAGIESLIRRLRDSIPELMLRTTFMVGFPGETDSEFEELLDFCENARFENIGIFKYSPEDGTPAADFKDRIAEDIIEERFLTLLDLQNSISKAKLESRIGQIQPVLIHEIGEDYGATGRAWFQAPEVDGVTYVRGCGAAPGEMIRARITGADSYDLFAESIEEE